MTLTPRVSVVVPSYNNVAHIERTLESVLGQTFVDFELVLSDHSSSDGTWQAVQRFAVDPRVRLTQIPPGGGAERNWNHVTSVAQGELIKLVCGDDLLHPECLTRQVAAFDAAGEGVTIVASQRDIVDTYGRVVARRRGLAGLTGRVSGSSALRRAVLSGTNIFGEPCCVLLPRADLAAVKGWDGRHGYVIDLATYARILERGDLMAVPEVLAAFRVSRGQWSIALEREQAHQLDAFRADVQRTCPGLLSRGDVLRSRLMTRLRTRQRRIAYTILRHRL